MEEVVLPYFCQAGLENLVRIKVKLLCLQNSLYATFLSVTNFQLQKSH